MREERKDIQRQVLSEAFQAAIDGYRLQTAVFLTVGTAWFMLVA